MKIQLQGIMMDTPILVNRSTNIDIELINPSGKLIIDTIDHNPRAIHVFELEDDSFIGKGDPYKLDIDESSMIFTLAISLLSKGVIFTPLATSFLWQDNGPVKIEVTKYIKIDENKLWSVAKNLLEFDIFKDENRSDADLNVMNAIEQYQEAIFSLGGTYAYKSLFAALEKCVNADKGKHGLKGLDLDKEASSITGFSESDIKKLRDLNNHFKHTVRKPKDYMDFLASKSDLGLYDIIKNVVDRAILYKIS